MFDLSDTEVLGAMRLRRRGLAQRLTGRSSAGAFGSPETGPPLVGPLRLHVFPRCSVRCYTRGYLLN